MQLISEVQQGQSFLDKVIQLTGSVESAFDVAIFNNMSITDKRQIGDVVKAEKVTNKRVANFFKNIQPATASNIELNNKGIGYWSIGENFIIS